eukprot:CAMPEP_0184031180 /NCGR_PEP_ID=MMETSP0955-20130417/2054_1 /TAXON_ID=627963 /ORGANISM="Aplanochytrium sp, Strain PBS07" /LENGTH=338 /DNA_ID=CAMNT_0026316849 /DNA_START=309 /DNA_END=1325 /DNA_ORIENTATION=+
MIHSFSGFKDPSLVTQGITQLRQVDDVTEAPPESIVEEDFESFKCQVIRRSHLYSEECGNVGPLSHKRPLLITGTGRSGTDFVHTLLLKLGLALSHDVRGPAKDGGVSWPEAFNERLCKHPHWNWRSQEGGGSNKGKLVTFDHIFHLVRHPLKQILSRANGGEWVSSENRRVTACNTVSDIGVDSTETKLNRAIILTMRHWVLYNSFIEQYAEWRFRLEQLNEDREYIIDQIFSRAEFTKPNEEKTQTAKVSTHKNGGHTKKPKNLDLTWDMLYGLDSEYAEMCQAMALSYGYDMDDTEILPNVQVKCDNGEVLTSSVDCYFNQDQKWKCVLSRPECP